MMINAVKMDSMETFETIIKERILQKMPKGTEMMFRAVVKNNDRRLTGAIISEPELNVSPTVYIDPYFEAVQEGQIEINDAVDMILRHYREHRREDIFDTSTFTDWNRAKHNIVPRLISRERNLELLKDAVHSNYLGMEDIVVVYTFITEIEGEGMGSIVIHNCHASEWGVDSHILKEIAAENAPRLLPATMESMKDCIAGFVGETPEEEILEKLYILSNGKKTYGASVVLYPDFLKGVAEKLGAKTLAVIPSSVHEVLVLPMERNRIPSLDGMVEEMNRTRIAPDNVLSDHAYCYDAPKDLLTMR